MPIIMSQIADDLRALDPADLEKLQQAVNGEVGARLQGDRFARRLERAVLDAQMSGFTDSEVNSVFNKARIDARGRSDPDVNLAPPSNPVADLRGAAQEKISPDLRMTRAT